MLDRLWLSNNGPLVQQFENRIADYIDVKHCICVCNATIGLELAIRAIGMQGEVIVPSYTFVATAHALQWQQITPVFADMDEHTHNIDPKLIERHITPRTTGVVATHVWGRPCDIEALEWIANKYKLTLMFDAAHAFGCSYKGKMIGGFGKAEVFSFHATKFLNSFEGGAITTNDDNLANKIRLMTNFGFVEYDKVIHLGTNGKMTEVCAAMGLANLEHIDDLIAINRRNFNEYLSGIEDVPGCSILPPGQDQVTNYQYVVLKIDEDAFGLNRDQLIRVLHAENILARKYFWPGCHRMEPYRSLYPYAEKFLPVTEHISAQVVVLPTGTAVCPRSISMVIETLREASKHASQIHAALADG